MRRSYSICSPAGSGVLRVAVKRLTGGAFSEHALETLEPGNVLDVMTPTGRFFTPLEPANRKHYVCVAAGSGITPVLSIVASTLASEPDSPVTLVYINRTHKSVMFLEEIEDLKDGYADRFQLIHVLSREPQEVELFSGRLDVARMGRILGGRAGRDRRRVVPLRSPRDGLRATAAARRRGGLQADDPRRGLPRRDRAAGPSYAGGGRCERARVTITLDGRPSTFTLPPTARVLDAALQVRSDAPFACKGGVCGTCRAKVLEGSVSMDTNWALEPDEVDKGYVLTCQSHPTSDAVVLDYDA